VPALWTVLIPIKALPGAKSRLTDATDGQHAHHRLVEAIRQDTFAAAATATGVARVVAVVDLPGTVELPSTNSMPADAGGTVELPATVELHSFVQSVTGLNAALGEADRWARDRWPDDGVVALVGDLPALRPADLAGALAAAEPFRRAFVPDVSGAGTTLLAAAAGIPLEPRFGPDSAARHAVGAERLEAAAGLRLDVDTSDDLVAALRLGVGVASRALLGADPGLSGSFASQLPATGTTSRRRCSA
jgi:2-phospho-L-lactate/phosphoenolpyruvate guanylyltransferase